MEATAVASATRYEHTRTGTSVEHLKRAFVDNLIYDQARYPNRASELDYYLAIAASVRDRMVQRWVNTMQTFSQHDVRVVCYFSAEFLLGPHLGNGLLNLGIEQAAAQRAVRCRIHDPDAARFANPRRRTGGRRRKFRPRSAYRRQSDADQQLRPDAR